MIATTNEYKRQLIAGNRNYVIKIPVFLKGNATQTPDFTLTNEHIWDNGIVLDEAISSDRSFDIGAAIVGSLQVIINNISGNYSLYDFYDAKLVLYLGVTGDVDGSDNQVYYRMGFFTVDTPSYNGSLITLNCLDNMTWFDLPFSDITGISYPTTAGQLVADICSHCGVTLGTVTFPNYTTAISVEPKQELNCREVLQYVAQICCCYCKIDTAGELALKWYNKQEIIGITDYDGGTFSTNTTPYSDGVALDGGSFDPWTTGDSADGGLFTDLMNSAYLSQNFEIEVSTDDIVVTGCRVVNNTSKDNEYDELWVDSTLEQTHERYVLVIENNPLVANATQAATIANIVGSTLAGLPIRGFTATSLSDFSYETGDMVTVIDFRGNRYYTWITHFNFVTNNAEQFSCGVESLKKRSETRYSDIVKTLAEANDNANALLTDYDNAVKALNDLAQDAIGYNKYQHTVTGGGIVTWLYNGNNIDTTDPERPLFPGSMVVFEISGDGVFISNDGGTSYTNGYDANSGTAILSLIYAVGINCDWIHAGTLTLGGNNNENGLLVMLNALGTEIGSWSKDGISIKSGSIKLNKQTISDSNTGLYLGSDGIALGASNAFVVDHQGNMTIKAGMFNQLGNGYMSLRESDTQYTWTFDFSQRYVNCMYYNNGWAWVNGGAYEIYHYLEGAWSPSDKRTKTEIEDLDVEFSRALIMRTKPKMFEFKHKLGVKQFGMIAQDEEQVLKDLDFTEKNGLVDVPDDPEEMLSIEYKQFVPHLINVVKSQQTEIDLLKQEIALLKEKVGT